MTKILLIAAIACGGCLDSPPSSAPGDEPDAGRPPECGELDLFTESFEEIDPDARFLELWDPGEAPYVIEQGSLVITGIPAESDVYSRYEYERSGALRVERMSLDRTGVAALSVWNDTDGAAGILLDDAQTVAYAPGGRQMKFDRDANDVSFAVGFDGGQLVFRASRGEGTWRILTTWPDPFSDLVRLGLATSTPNDTVEWSIEGINTEVDCQ